MYVIVLHEIKDAETAFARGEKLMKGEGAPAGTRVLQFYPSTDASTVVCLWESSSIDAVQKYCDATLGTSSVTTSFEVNADQAFSERPLGLPESAAIGA
jgi:hypothetical protein